MFVCGVFAHAAFFSLQERPKRGQNIVFRWFSEHFVNVTLFEQMPFEDRFSRPKSGTQERPGAAQERLKSGQEQPQSGQDGPRAAEDETEDIQNAILSKKTCFVKIVCISRAAARLLRYWGLCAWSQAALGVSVGGLGPKSGPNPSGSASQRANRPLLPSQAPEASYGFFP